MSGPSPGEEAATRKAMDLLYALKGAPGLWWRTADVMREADPSVGKAWARSSHARVRSLGPAAAHPAGYFLPFVAVAFWTSLCLSCLDFAWVATLALAIFFCFWLRCFDLGDLSPMVAPFDGGGHLREDRSLFIMGQAVKPS